jgi:hypothetical protein
MIINYEAIQLYSGKTDSFLDHDVLAPLLDQYADAEFQKPWLELDFKNSELEFAEALEQVVLKGAFDAYWASPEVEKTSSLYVKTVDAVVIVEKLGYQFSISNEDPFPTSTTNRGFPILEYLISE